MLQSLVRGIRENDHGSISKAITIIENGQNIKIGPKSVGFNIHTEGMIFGGSTITATDIAVGLGIADIGNAGPAKGLGNDFLVSAKNQINEMISLYATKHNSKQS